jgi:N-acetylneuraminate synthase/N,N'-diacetyllegionaminate synthase
MKSTLTTDKVLKIAEIGHNHNSDMELAKKMIQEAKDCGADIAKFQLYDVNKLPFSDEEKKNGIYDDLKLGQLTKEQLKILKDECDRVGIEFFASAFDIERVGWLEEIGVKRHKIASRMITDKDFIKAVEDTGKPIIVSLGWWNKPEFPEIKNCEFLYCISKYPTEDRDLINFPDKFDKYTGFSDHTIGTKWAKKAIDRGAKIIEKHFTLDKKMFGCDQAGSAEPQELKEICNYNG